MTQAMPDAWKKARCLARIAECEQELQEAWMQVEAAERALHAACAVLTGVQRRLHILKAATEGEEPSGL